MAVIDSVREFFGECPLLREGFINLNRLGDEKADYSVETVPSEPVYRRYVDGGELRQYVFVFASREFYDGDLKDNSEAAGFYEGLADWIEERNRSGRLPEITGGRALRLEVLSGGYVMSERAGTARYQMQIRLVYKKEE